MRRRTKVRSGALCTRTIVCTAELPQTEPVPTRARSSRPHPRLTFSNYTVVSYISAARCSMPDIGVPELLIILVIIVLFGSGRLAGAGKALGESIRGFRQAIREDEAWPSCNEPS